MLSAVCMAVDVNVDDKGVYAVFFFVVLVGIFFGDIAIIV